MERRTPRSKRTETPLPYPSLFRSHDVRNELQAATFRLRERSRLRLLVSRRGSIAIEVREYRTWPQAIMQVAIVPRNAPAADARLAHKTTRSEEHTSELQSLMRISYAVFCLKKKNNT